MGIMSRIRYGSQGEEKEGEQKGKEDLQFASGLRCFSLFIRFQMNLRC